MCIHFFDGIVCVLWAVVVVVVPLNGKSIMKVCVVCVAGRDDDDDGIDPGPVGSACLVSCGASDVLFIIQLSYLRPSFRGVARHHFFDEEK